MIGQRRTSQTTIAVIPDPRFPHQNVVADQPRHGVAVRDHADPHLEAGDQPEQRPDRGRDEPESSSGHSTCSLPHRRPGRDRVQRTVPGAANGTPAVDSACMRLTSLPFSLPLSLPLRPRKEGADRGDAARRERRCDCRRNRRATCPRSKCSTDTSPEKQLQEVIAFYKSETGRRFVEAQAEIIADVRQSATANRSRRSSDPS